MATSTIDAPRDTGSTTGTPHVIHVVKRDPVTGAVLEPKIALCGHVCEKALNGRPAGGILCERCEALALQGWGAAPTR